MSGLKQLVNLEVDGKEVSVPEGTTVLEAARRAGIRIPTLCHLPGLPPKGNCRLCVVEVEGWGRLAASCSTPVREGMRVRTNSYRVRESRRTTLELLLAHHAVDCEHCLRIGDSDPEELDPALCEMCFFCDCVRKGACELQALAREYGVGELPFPIRNEDFEVDDTSPALVLDPNKCVKCRRCVSACREAQGVGNLCIAGTGRGIRIAPAFGRKMGESGCVGCGRCAEVCPTAAIHLRNHSDELIGAAHSYGTRTAALLCEDVLPELGRLCGLQGPADFGKVAAGLRKIGVDRVYSGFAAEALAARAFRPALEAAVSGGLAAIVTTGHGFLGYAAKRLPGTKVLRCESPRQAFARVLGEGVETDEGTKPLRRFVFTNRRDMATEAVVEGTNDIVADARELHRIFVRTGVDLKRILPSAPDSLPGVENGDKALARVLAPAAWAPEGGAEECEAEIFGKRIAVVKSRNFSAAGKLVREAAEGKKNFGLLVC